MRPLLALGLLLAVVAAPAPASAGSPGRKVLQARSADVIVVGAGMSGIAAAKAVKDKGGASVIVLEGRQRVGGRCWTQELAEAGGGTVAVDLGAGWVHGVTGNPMIGLAQAAGVPVAAKKTNYNNAALFLPDGKPATDAQEARWEALYADFMDAVTAQQEALDGRDTDPALGRLAAQHLARQTGLERQALRYLMNTNLEHEYAGSLPALSLWYDEGADENGGDVFVTGGYQRVVQWAAKGIDVRLGHRVTAIDSSSPNAITITVAGVGSFTAKRVIVTVPLGVLKAGAISFVPSGLPAANRQAISQLGMGLLNKLIMVFPFAFWTDYSAVEVFNRISPPFATGAWAETYSMSPITGQPVLIAFNAADYAWQLETLGAEETKAKFMAVLRSLFGPLIPQPVSFVVTQWGKDPFSFGSYSFTRSAPGGAAAFAQAHADSGKAMAGGRILFAGEHTSAEHPATAHGAWMSGLAAAASLKL